MADAGRLTNKTEFMRYVNVHPQEVPALRRLLREYMGTKTHSNNFGLWVRNNRPLDFHSAYSRWWLKRPKLFGVVYAELAGQNQ